MRHTPKTHTANFNSIARPYRWMEYLTFGRLLQRCRIAHLPRLTACTHALILGDGDGRFLAALIAANPRLSADVIDASATMLQLARNRIQPFQAEDRISFHCADIRDFNQTALHSKADLLTAHFFLDCLTEEEVSRLFSELTPALLPGALCIISDFAVPSRQPARLFARLLVGALYLAFRLLTGLRIRKLPQHAAILQRAGFTLEAAKTSLGGILRSECWIAPQ